MTQKACVRREGRRPRGEANHAERMDSFHGQGTTRRSPFRTARRADASGLLATHGVCVAVLYHCVQQQQLRAAT